MKPHIQDPVQVLDEKMKRLVIKDVGGFEHLNLEFMPGWSTGPRDGEHIEGVSVQLMFDRKEKFKAGEWSGSGIIKKEQAIALAQMILEYYKPTI